MTAICQTCGAEFKVRYPSRPPKFCSRACFHPPHGHCTRKCYSRTYSTWRNMIQRCTAPDAPNYKYYGDIGVTVCKRWLSFTVFLGDMGERPPRMTLDRYPNKSGNYEPGNCRSD